MYPQRACSVSQLLEQVKSVQEIDAVVDLTANAFADEVRGSGLTSPQWQGLEKEHLINNPPLWRHVGKRACVLSLLWSGSFDWVVYLACLWQRCGLYPATIPCNFCLTGNICRRLTCDRGLHGSFAADGMPLLKVSVAPCRRGCGKRSCAGGCCPQVLRGSRADADVLAGMQHPAWPATAGLDLKMIVCAQLPRCSKTHPLWLPWQLSFPSHLHDQPCTLHTPS